MDAELARWAVIDGPLSGLFCERAQVIRREGWVQVVSADLSLAARNEVLWAALPEADADRVIDATIAHYRALETPFKWSVPPGSGPADLAERLRARGLVSWWARAMSCPVELAIEMRGAVRTEALVPANVPAFVSLVGRGWEVPEAWHERFCQEHRRGLAVGRLLGVLAYAGGEALGSATAIVSGPRAYLAGGQVLPHARGRGIYRALLSARLQALAARGVCEVVTLAREQTSAPILAKLGFRTLCSYEIFRGDVSPPRDAT